MLKPASIITIEFNIEANWPLAFRTCRASDLKLLTACAMTAPPHGPFRFPGEGMRSLMQHVRETSGDGDTPTAEMDR